MKEERVLQALRALAENDREREAPPDVEACLLGGFNALHARRARRIRRRLWAGVAALAAGIAIALLLWPNRAPKPVVSAALPVTLVPESTQPEPATAAVTVAKAARAPHKLLRKVPAAPQPEAREVVTDFFPLLNPAPSLGRGQMLRVQLPAAAMQTVGLPVREENLGDLVQADVLVGEEGMPRAIRFVRFDVK
jgi:hypothetical protein